MADHRDVDYTIDSYVTVYRSLGRKVAQFKNTTIHRKGKRRFPFFTLT